MPPSIHAYMLTRGVWTRSSSPVRGSLSAGTLSILSRKVPFLRAMYSKKPAASSSESSPKRWNRARLRFPGLAAQRRSKSFAVRAE